MSPYLIRLVQKNYRIPNLNDLASSSKDILKQIYLKNLYLRKKSSWPRAALDLARVEKGEVILNNTAPKSYLKFFFLYQELLLVVRIREPNWRQEILASRKVLSLASSIAGTSWSFPRNESKIKRKSITEILPS